MRQSLRRLLKFIREKIELTFVVIALSFGLFLVFFTPPITVVDEDVHFFRAYGISQGKLVAQNIVGESYGLTQPLNTTQFIFESKVLALSVNNQNLGTFSESWSDDSIQKPKNSAKINNVFNGSAVYPPVLYAPQGLGMITSKLFSLDNQWYIYLGRLCNLFVFVVLMYIAIRIIPVGKYILFTVALLPMSLYHAASLSMDGSTIALFAVFAALVLRIVYEQKSISRKTLVLLALVSIALALAKPIYVLFSAIVLGLLRKPFISDFKQKIYLVMFVLLLPGLLAASWYYVMRHVDISIVAPMYEKILPVHQVKYIILNPIDYASTALHTVFIKDPQVIFGGMIGRFGWSNELFAYLPVWSILLGYCALVLSALVDRGNNVKTNVLNSWKKLKPYVLGGVILMLLGVVTTLYVTFNPVGSNTVYGLQGRYFIPILMPILLLVAISKKSVLTTSYVNKAKLLIVFITIANLSTAVFVINNQYY